MGEAALHRPGPALAPYVPDAVGYRTDPGPRGTHQGIPSGHLVFILCLDGSVELVRMSDLRRSPGVFTAMVGGLHTTPAVVATGPPQAGIQLRLTWRGARALFGLPASELAGDVVDLAALLGRRADRLLELLAEAPSWSDRFALLDAALTRLLADGRGEAGVLPEVGYAWDRLAETGGLLRIEELACEVGWSRHHLADRFRRETGLGLKSAARLIRFERACDRLRSPRPPTLATVAADCGYVDQAHLSRDFRELAGIPATEWLAERLADPEPEAVSPPRPPRDPHPGSATARSPARRA